VSEGRGGFAPPNIGGVSEGRGGFAALRIPHAQKKIQSKIPTQNYSILPPSATVHFAITNYPKPVFHFFLMIDVIKAGQPLPYEMVKEQVKTLVIHEKSNKGFEEYAKQLLLKVKSNNEVQFFD
jgi:hypothetical protein